LTVDDSDVRALNRRIDSHFVVIEDSALPWLDSGYPLVFPAMALFLLWFRRGWTLTWAWLLLPLLLAGGPGPVQAQAPAGQTAAGERAAGGLHASLQWFADLWLSGDQQGRLLLQAGEYRAAAARFEEPMWKGLGYYYAEDFLLAAEYFSRSDSDDALFNEANARAHARDYVRAVNRYDRLLARNPDYPGARHNRQRVQELIDEINRLSESQQAEPGVSGEDKELGTDDAIPAEGAEELSWEQAKTVKLTAEQILEDPATGEMWLRSVQQDPSNFLAIKFGMQLQREEETQ
jgi:Ca-activated chloride channel family protein